MAAAIPVTLSPSPATAGQKLAHPQAANGTSITPDTLFGWSLNEATGSALAKVRLHDGATSAGAELGVAEMAAGAPSQVVLPPAQVMSGDVYLEVVFGSVEGVVFLGGGGAGID